MLCQQTITDFKKLYRQKEGVELSEEEAEVKALELLKFMRLVYRQLPDINQKNDHETNKTRPQKEI